MPAVAQRDAVFGEGAALAAAILVGEQPGDPEDLTFLGAAGRILERALADARIDRMTTYITNAVQHFKNVPRGKRRPHRRPDAKEIEVCCWWLAEERRLVAPCLTAALGATAARTVLGRPAAIGKLRGSVIEGREGRTVAVTAHLSFVLRQRDEAARNREFAQRVRDLTAVRKWLDRRATA